MRDERFEVPVGGQQQQAIGDAARGNQRINRATRGDPETAEVAVVTGGSNGCG
jgi:hypothetical protein